MLINNPFFYKVQPTTILRTCLYLELVWDHFLLRSEKGITTKLLEKKTWSHQPPRVRHLQQQEQHHAMTELNSLLMNDQTIEKNTVPPTPREAH